ncbi:MAG: hypothetical protein FWC61_01750 [Proteobacteria bacterium]|nr:hypothetical protein [Pseudomonadota bacterium]
MMKKFIVILSLCHCVAFACIGNANAYEYSNGRYGMRITGMGTAGALQTFDSANQGAYFVGDFRLRGQFNYAARAGWTTGAVVSSDRLSWDTRNYLRDLFLFVESPYGRAELGRTDSIASKLGLGLPDVGGLRLNDYTMIYDAIPPAGPVIANTTVGGTRYAFRATMVSLPTNPVQYGFSFVPYSKYFKYAADAGLKYRMPEGKTKIALSAGASVILEPRGLADEIYAAPDTSDWRAQVSGGLNLQYNSWNWGLSARGIYDQNPVGPPSDGISAGTGLSYDFLGFSVSASYLASYTGIFHSGKNYLNHVGILSGRYKFNKYFDTWISGGAAMTADRMTPFVSGGLRGTF